MSAVVALLAHLPNKAAATDKAAPPGASAQGTSASAGDPASGPPKMGPKSGDKRPMKQQKLSVGKRGKSN